MFKFSERSLKALEGVDEGLVRVCHKMLKVSPYDIGVISGVRTKDEQASLVARGKSQTLNSKHITGDAIDFIVYVGGEYTEEPRYYKTVIQAFFTSAIEEGVQIKAGGLWETFKDYGHIERG